MNELDLQLLERYLDGEISADEVTEVEQALASDEVWQAAHRDLLATRTAVKAHFEAMTEGVDFSDLWSKVEAQLPEGAPEAAPVAPAAVEQVPVQVPVQAPAQPWWQRLVPAVLLTAGAAAAVAFFIGRASQQGTQGPQPAPIVDNSGKSDVQKNEAPKLRPAPNPALPPSRTAPELKTVGKVVVDEVQSDGENRVIINQSEGNAPTVIWLLDGGSEAPTNDATLVEDPI
ncbi:MAG: anti-sigma factor family protein [Bradymonadia bacterium]